MNNEPALQYLKFTIISSTSDVFECTQHRGRYQWQQRHEIM